MLELDQMSYSKGGRRILRELNLILTPGNIYSILGVNGSGKTTLLKILAGIWQPTAGAVKWNGDDIRFKSRKELSQLIAMVAHNQPITFSYTVREIVNMGGYANSLINTNSLVKSALKKAGVAHLENRLITQLSNGERQRVFIARALVGGSPVLLLDEPFTGLDLKHQVEILKLLQNLKEQGKLILITSHDLAMTKDLSDLIILLDSGECKAIGKYEEVITPSVLHEIFGVTEKHYSSATYTRL